MPINDDKRCNELTGKEWLQNSFSIWRIAKTKAEKDLGHPASYPIELCEKLIKTFTKNNKSVVLDPFNGIGSSMVASKLLDRSAVGIELSEEFCEIANQRVSCIDYPEGSTNTIQILQGDSFKELSKIQNDTIDLCITSPPYWDILSSKRSADKNKNIEKYSNKDTDLGNITDYNSFILSLKELFSLVYEKIKPGGYCIVNVMDLRKKSTFFPLHIDLSNAMQEIGFKFDDLIIWDRQQDYNNMRPLGYPYKFRINKVHEYLLIFEKVN